MDDKQLADLFRAAADEAAAGAPPPRFDHDAVLAGSHRMARRQRATVAVAVAAMAVIGAGAVFSGVLRGPSPTSALAERPPASDRSTSSGNAPTEGITSGGAVPGNAPGAPVAGVAPVPGAAPGPAPQMAPAPYAAKSAPHADALNAAPGDAPLAADSADPSARSKVLADPGGCTGPDPRVYTQLTVVLPEVRSAIPHAVAGGCAPGGAGVAVEVEDAGATGTLVAVLTPPTVSPAVPPETPTQLTATARTPSGGLVRLTAAGAGPGGIPYRPRLPQLAAALAAHL